MGKKTGKKCKAVHTGRNNCINTVRRTSQVRVLREDPLLRGDDNLNMRYSQAIDKQAGWTRNRTVARITHRVILPLY